MTAPGRARTIRHAVPVDVDGVVGRRCRAHRLVVGREVGERGLGLLPAGLAAGSARIVVS